MKKPIEASWPASKTEMWPLERIKPYDKNPRDHSPEQIDLIAKSMLDDGVTAPILVDEQGVIIYGHGRRMAAEKNAFKSYPVVVARGYRKSGPTGSRTIRWRCSRPGRRTCCTAKSRC